jgi:MarR family 2-MHQ and catechol resistance regulon transcriptional repressor
MKYLKDNQKLPKVAPIGNGSDTTADVQGSIPDALERDAAELHEALTALVRLYQFRDRNGICCEDVSVTQCYTLNAIVRLGSPTLGELAGEMYLDKSTTSRVVDSLARKGHAHRVGDAADRRAVRVESTPEGRALVERVERRLIDGEKELISDFDPEVRQATAKLIARLARAARARHVRQGQVCCEPHGGREKDTTPNK